MPQKLRQLRHVGRDALAAKLLIAAIDAFADHQVSTLPCSHKETASFFDLKDFLAFARV
jgi:hypothetical protein